MDRRNWPWKKKSSDKTLTEKPIASLESAGSNMSLAEHLGDQEKFKKVSYVQIPMESYTRISSLEDQVKTLENQVKGLGERLVAAELEIKSKDNLVKEHVKVAEEAVSGWEKADKEANALKAQLESVKLLKVTAEDRASHLDSALKECTRRIRNVMENSEQKLQDMIVTKSRQWEKMKLELETKIVELDYALHKAYEENAVLVRTLQERSSVIMMINEEKSQADAEIEILKKNILSYEKDITSLKYELHVVSKELDIRSEEKNITMRSAEVADKKHLEDVKKIGKLEAECQRLRSLMRKRLPGPAALAQMTLEAENSGLGIGESLVRRTPAGTKNMQSSTTSDFFFHNLQQHQKEFNLLNTRLLSTEAENKMLKEALAARTSELQASKFSCSKMVAKVESFEAQAVTLNQWRSSPKLKLELHTASSSSRIASITASAAKNNIDPEGDRANSCVPLFSTSPHFSTDRIIDPSDKNEKDTCLRLMDDFLEMEKLACSSDNVDMDVSTEINSDDSRAENDENTALVCAAEDGDPHSHQHLDQNLSLKQGCLDVNTTNVKFKLRSDYLPLQKLQSAISIILRSQPKDSNMQKVFEEIQCAMLEVEESFKRNSSHPPAKEADSDNDPPHCQQAYIQEAGRIGHDHSDCLDCKNDKMHINSLNNGDTVTLDQTYNDRHGSVNRGSNSEFVQEEHLSPSPDLELELIRGKSNNGDNAVNHERSMKEIEKSELQLQAKEQLVVELKRQLETSLNSCSLAEIQLKCMTESYKSLEIRQQELEAEAEALKEKIKSLEHELLEKELCVQDVLSSSGNGQETMQSFRHAYVIEKCWSCSSLLIQCTGKVGKDQEIVTAEKKLAECQQTINLLGKQLQTLRPQIDVTKPGHRSSTSQGSCLSNESEKAESESAESDYGNRMSGEISAHNCSSPSSFSETEANPSSKSSVSSLNSSYELTKSDASAIHCAPPVRKQPRGLNRFFPSKANISN